MKIYTRTGDCGTTGLLGGERVGKSDGRVEAYGTVDELNAVIGWATAELDDREIAARLELIQRDLFAVGASLAVGRLARRKKRLVPDLPVTRVEEMERWMDAAEAELVSLGGFILPGGVRGAAALHVARTVCRRAERSVVALSVATDVDPDILRYLNRLADLLFVLARLANARAGGEDRLWKG